MAPKFSSSSGVTSVQDVLSQAGESVATIRELCQQHILHAEGNHDPGARARAMEHVLKGMISGLWGGVDRWDVDVDVDPVQGGGLASIIAALAPVAVLLEREIGSQSPQYRTCVDELRKAFGNLSLKALRYSQSDYWTALRGQALGAIREYEDLSRVGAEGQGFVDGVYVGILPALVQKTQGRVDAATQIVAITEAECDAAIQTALTVGMATGLVPADLCEDVRPMLRKRAFKVLGYLPSRDELERLALVMLFANPLQQPGWMLLAPQDWQFVSRWDQAVGTWGIKACQARARSTRPSGVFARREAAWETLDDAVDASNELYLLFRDQLARDLEKAFVQDRNPYGLGYLPTTWWSKIISAKASDAWNQVRGIKNRRIGGMETRVVHESLDGVISETERGPLRPRQPESALANAVTVEDEALGVSVYFESAARLLPQVVRRERLLNGYSVQDAVKIQRAAAEWLVAHAEAELEVRGLRARGMYGNVALPCRSSLQSRGALGDLPDPDGARRAAGQLAERAFYLALHAAGGVLRERLISRMPEVEWEQR